METFGNLDKMQPLCHAGREGGIVEQTRSWREDPTVAIGAKEQGGIPAHTIPGTLCAPKNTEGKKLPAVVMLHGTGSSRDEAGGGYALAAPRMAQAGIVTLRIDFMGSGDSAADYRDYNYSSASIDAKAAADYLASLDYVDPDKIAVLGWSQGGTNALLAAADHPDTFRTVITWSGADHTYNVFAEGGVGFPTLLRAIDAGTAFLQEVF